MRIRSWIFHRWFIHFDLEDVLFIYVYMYICIYVYMYICIYVYMYICIYVYMYICIYVYMYMYVYIYSPLDSFRKGIDRISQ